MSPVIRKCVPRRDFLFLVFFLFVFFGNPTLISAQSPSLQELAQSLEQTKEDSDRVVLLIQIGEVLLEEDKDSALATLELAHNISEIDSIGSLRSLTLEALADFYFKENDLSKAELNYTQARTIAEELADWRRSPELSSKLARIQSLNRDFENSAFNYLKAFQGFKKTNQPDRQVASLWPIATLFFELENYERAAYYFEEIVLICKNHQINALLVNALERLGRSLIEQGEEELAHQYLDEALSLAQTNKKGKVLPRIYNSFGELYLREGDFRKARSFALKSLDQARRIDDKPLISDNYNTLADIALNQKNYFEALQYQRFALSIALNFPNKERVKDYYLKFSRLYEKAGNLRNALLYHQKYSNLRDSLDQQTLSQSILTLETKYQSNKKEREIQRLLIEQRSQDEQLKRRRIINYSLGFGFILFIGFTFFLYRSYQDLKKANLLLQERNWEIEKQKEKITYQKSSLEAYNEKLSLTNQELKELDQEKNHLIGVVAHDLRSPINQVRGLLELIKLSQEEINPEQESHMKMASQSLLRLDKMISRILDVNAMEQEAPDLHMEQLDVAQLLEQVVTSYRELAAQKDIELIFQSQGGSFMSELDENYARLIFENLISNAIKFSPLGKKVYIQTRESSESIRASIRDEGPGFAQEDKLQIFGKFRKLSAKPTAGEPSTGLGLSIVKRYTDLMGAKIHLESEWGKGANFILEFKKANTETLDPQRA